MLQYGLQRSVHFICLSIPVPYLSPVWLHACWCQCRGSWQDTCESWSVAPCWMHDDSWGNAVSHLYLTKQWSTKNKLYNNNVLCLGAVSPDLSTQLITKQRTKIQSNHACECPISVHYKHSYDSAEQTDLSQGCQVSLGRERQLPWAPSWPPPASWAVDLVDLTETKGIIHIVRGRMGSFIESEVALTLVPSHHLMQK